MEKAYSFWQILGLGAAALHLAACGDAVIQPVSLTNTACSAGIAQVAVRDGMLEILCGCQEGAQIVAPPATLTCTIPANTTVFFHYLATKLKHQVVPQSANAFVASPPSDPSARFPYRSHPVRFTTSGTFGFQDSFNLIVVGNIVVL